MQGITLAVTTAAGEEVTALLNMYREDIDKAYLKKEGALTVPMSLKFKPGSETSDDLEVEVKINFVPEKISDSIMRIVNEKQGELFDKDK